MRTSRVRPRRFPIPLAVFVTAALLVSCSSSDGRTPAGAASPLFELPTPPAVTPIASGLAEEDAVTALRARPLWLPALSSGAACPTSTSRALPSPIAGDAYGDGPLYLLAGAADPEAVLTVGERRAAKAIWQIAPGRDGPFLVRGYHLDGGGAITFDEGARDLVISRVGEPGGPGAAAGWRDRPSLVRASEDGCYALQIDGLDFTSAIVVEVKSTRR